MNDNNNDIKFMGIALVQARIAFDSEEVPIGAVIAREGQIIAKAFNQIETLKDATAHAEISVIREASRILNNWRLEDCDLYVTLEPCPMCFSAIRLARIRKLVIGASESRIGTISRFESLISDSHLGPKPQIVEGILKDECATILRDFFARLRK